MRASPKRSRGSSLFDRADDSALSRRSACGCLAVCATLTVLLGVWACALEPWKTPTARALFDDVRYRVLPGHTPLEDRLWAASSRCEAETVRRLLQQGASPRHDRGGGHGTALHAVAAASASARGDCMDAAAALVQAGADPLARDPTTGRAPLHMALACDRLDPTCPNGSRRNPPVGLFLQSIVQGRRGRVLAMRS